MKYYITGTRRGLGKYLNQTLQNLGHLQVENISECDVFLNVKHDGFHQVRMLYKAAEIGVKRIVSIGSNSSDGIKSYIHPYAIEKAALDKANEQLFHNGVNTTVLRFGYMDTERVAHINEPKMSVDYCSDIVIWVLEQPYRLKELTITP
jgi:hypothetical protein